MKGSRGEDIRSLQPSLFSNKTCSLSYSFKWWKDIYLIALNPLNASISSVSPYIKFNKKIMIKKMIVGYAAHKVKSHLTYCS